MLAAKARRHQRFNGLAHQFGSFIAEQLFHLHVHQQNGTFSVYHDHAGRCRLHHQPKLLLRLLALSDVADKGRECRLRRCAYLRHCELNGELRAVGAHRRDFQPFAYDGRFPCREVPREASMMPLAKRWWNN